jgi:hypothetical protein
MTTKFHDLLEITCPYCGNKFRQRFEVELHPYRQDVTTLCDIDETPGCDKYFVVSLQLKINLLETYKLVPVN